MDIKCAQKIVKCTKNVYVFYVRLSEKYQKLDFGYTNIPSGNIALFSPYRDLTG
jgi:hypothetical protein